jgi:hypothetical protein
MNAASFEAVASAFERAGVRYLIVGGLAVNVYGYRRLTADIDIVMELLPDNIERAFQALLSLSFKPVVPVTQAQFADAVTREALIRDKGMVVLSFWSEAHPGTTVDVFSSEPFEFETEYGRAKVMPLTADLAVRIVARDTLLAMKRATGRAKDLADVEYLEGDA